MITINYDLLHCSETQTGKLCCLFLSSPKRHFVDPHGVGGGSFLSRDPPPSAPETFPPPALPQPPHPFSRPCRGRAAQGPTEKGPEPPRTEPGLSATWQRAEGREGLREGPGSAAAEGSSPGPRGRLRALPGGARASKSRLYTRGGGLRAPGPHPIPARVPPGGTQRRRARARGCEKR